MKTFHIKQKFWSLSGKFLVKDGQDQPCYQVTGSLLRWFKPRYHIEGLDMVIQGNFWDMDFTLTKHGQTIAVINQEWFKLTSTYQVTVHDEDYADLVVALVIAIDYVKEKEAAAASSAAT